MGIPFAFISFVAGGLVVAWFFVPGFRDRMRGMTVAMIGAGGALAGTFAKIKGWL